MRVIFMGTPDFAVPTLCCIKEAGHDIAAVVTQPDKPKGRGKAVVYPPVKEKALELLIPVLQPERMKAPEFLEQLKELKPDIIVVIAFGRILPHEILTLPKYGCINVHASLLPKYRGAAPIQWVVMNGEEEAGVTTMYMDEGLDTGDMLLKASIPLEPKETGGSLHDKLSILGAELLIKTLEQIQAGTLVREKQEDSDSTYVKMLTKELGKIDFSKSSEEIERLIRGLNPWPSAYTSLHGKTLKIWDADVCADVSDKRAGTVTAVTGDAVIVKTGNGSLAIKELQLEGKKRMKTGDFLRGYTITIGEILE